MPQFPYSRCHPLCLFRHAVQAALAICMLFITSCTVPAEPLDRGMLTALQSAVDRLRNEKTYSLPKDESVDLLPNDEIAVDENGRALVTFQDDLAVELFRSTKVEITDVRQQPAGFPLIWMNQIGGHSDTELKGQAYKRFRLTTSYATFRPTEPDSEFAVCHAEGVLTCMVTLKGAVEVEAQGQVVTALAGQASYILAGQPPTPPICADVNQVRNWLDALRSHPDVGDLGTIVIGWPQTPCRQASAAPTTDTATPAATVTETETAGNAGSGMVEASPPTAPSAQGPEGMVEVAGGRYLVGSAVAADEFHVTTQPVDLAAFWIDSTEVTDAQYAAYLGATGSAPPATWVAGQIPAGQEQHPVRGLTWNDADAYCHWVGKRLPTEAEWEAAARGQTDTAVAYPWGDDPAADGQTGQLPLVTTYPVGTLAFNRSPAGAYDMIGNVWEWVGEPYAMVAENLHILHGGRFGLLRDIAYRQVSEADNKRFVDYAGVRCAADQ